MIKLIIADDEPLVQAGIKSMIRWEDYDISIVGTASNGAAAYELIKKHSPEIVITDIKMPVMSGLELAAKCHEEGRKLPLFIILTSYEDFHFVKEALTYQVVAYLIKLEVTPEALTDTLNLALKRVSELQSSLQTADTSVSNLSFIKEQFYTRLIFHLFESEQQIATQAENLNINLQCKAFIVSCIDMTSDKLTHMSSDKQMTLYDNCLQMTRELLAKYLPQTPCHVMSVDTGHFGIIFFLDETSADACQDIINATLEQVAVMLFNYYSVTIHAALGSPVHTPIQIADSYREAKQALAQASNADYKHPIVDNVKKYIQEHIEEKLTLNKVAGEFNISSNYLSVLFSKHSDIGFSDYINQSKIEAAKKMMMDENYKIYEISDKLGFESAFYFSRVFKKVTGLSPRDYINHNLPYREK
ncbi:MAG: response regulator [Bacillus sp. (in: Bacteria)]|nr:response regulator [Bacillus sp. (in: firmicutes)]MCM1426570.1 response regulator [Eubacterium sp.]